MTGTKNRRRNQYGSGLIGTPSLLVLVLFFAIWSLWSFDRLAEAKIRSASEGRLIYAKMKKGYDCINPMDMIRQPRVAIEMAGPSSVLISHYKPAFKPLERKAYVNVDSSMGFERKSGYGVDGFERGYFSLWDDIPVFEKNIGSDNLFVLELSGNLKKYGFYLPKNSEKLLKAGVSAWQVVVYVATDDKGRVEHVFVEKCSDDIRIDRTVVRAMYKGRLVKEGRRVTGNVTVSFSGKGREKI
ncbi:MAG: hypothetical protein KAH23_09760 [Kiritimatiellae bacterium]|nr:hypothetical protein [Kiritimatiellia bacterium]